MATKVNLRRASRAERPSQQSMMRDDVRAFKRELILTTAIDIFFEKGYQTASVEDIATAMSVTKTVVYYNCNSKDELLEGIIDRVIALTHQCIDRGIQLGKSPGNTLALVCFLYADHMITNQKMVAVYFREERNFTAALRRRSTTLEKSVDDRIAGILDSGIASGEFVPCDTRLMALTITGMISMAFHWYRETGRVSREGICRHFAEQALKLMGFKGDARLDEIALSVGAAQKA
jgi:AcrR family transcriptional regulator